MVCSNHSSLSRTRAISCIRVHSLIQTLALSDGPRGNPDQKNDDFYLVPIVADGFGLYSAKPIYLTSAPSLYDVPSSLACVPSNSTVAASPMILASVQNSIFFINTVSGDISPLHLPQYAVRLRPVSGICMVVVRLSSS